MPDVEINCIDPLCYPVVLIYFYHIAVDHICIRILPKKSTHCFQGPGEKNVVGIDPRHVAARSLCCADVDRVPLTTVGLAPPVGQERFVPPDNINAPVIGTTVYDNVIQVGIVLIVNGYDGFFQEGCLVKRGSNYSDPGP